jgi:hypothetical protein
MSLLDMLLCRLDDWVPILAHIDLRRCVVELSGSYILASRRLAVVCGLAGLFDH